MAISQRLPVFLRRIFNPATIRYLLLIASDPRYGPLFSSLQKNSPVARLKAPSLWFAWRAAPVVEQDLAARESPHVLEWGSGGSTRWLADRSASVISIEHHAGWAELCRKHIGDGVEIRHVPQGPASARPELDYSVLDCVIIAGIMRVECAKTVAERISAGDIRDGTLVIFDNSERDIYREGIEALE